MVEERVTESAGNVKIAEPCPCKGVSDRLPRGVLLEGRLGTDCNGGGSHREQLLGVALTRAQPRMLVNTGVTQEGIAARPVRGRKAKASERPRYKVDAGRKTSPKSTEANKSEAKARPKYTTDAGQRTSL